MKITQAKQMAISGLLAAAAVVLMLLGGLIPMSTYTCPMLATLLCSVVFMLCGTKTALLWYVAVSILVLLTGSDKEAAFVFLLLGYYPVLKPRIDKSPLRLLWKVLLFNSVVLILTVLLMILIGLEFSGKSGFVSVVLSFVLLLLGNLVFFLLDRLLTILERKISNGRKHR